MTQAQALSILTTGASIFLTGEPGSGKTHTVGAYVEWLRGRGIEPAITAATGIAATHLQGTTIHAWSGMGIASQATDALVDAIASKEHVVRRIQKTSVLIIDEISMLSADALTLVDRICKEVRHSERAFGGLQVVLVGDFFQLPPIRSGTQGPAFAFESASWKALNPLVCYLHEQHRQDDDRFLSVLASIRLGESDPTTISVLMRRECDAEGLDPDVPRLYTHNADVDRVNDERLAELTTTGRSYPMNSAGSAALIESLKRGCLSPERLVLKEGAVVMGTKNIPALGLFNGTLGTILGFEQGTGYPMVETRDGRTLTIPPATWMVEEGGKVRASIEQVPLRLAWAITVHKSQGMSMDAAAIDLSRAFEYGQGYVALSRVRTLDGLFLLGWSEQALAVNPKILIQDEEFRGRSAVAEESFDELALSGELETMSQAFVKAAGGSAVPLNPDERAATAKLSTTEITLKFIYEGMMLEAIAKERGMTLGTICGHAEKLLQQGSTSAEVLQKLLPARVRAGLPIIAKKCGSHTQNLTDMKKKCGDEWSFDDLKLAKLVIGR